MKLKGIGGKVYFDGDQRIHGMEPEALHFHIVPSRPADLLVTIDPDIGSVNAMAGSYGPCSWQPLTLHLHFNNRVTSHTYHNLKATGECVLALPGRDLVRETWILNLPTPRGINELEVANLTPIPSRYVKPPGIKECPVNLECVVELTYDLYMTGLAVVRVIGGSIDEELAGKGSKDRVEIMRSYPLYETDTAPGVPERFGLMGDLLDCPLFPVGIGFGSGGAHGLVQWMSALKEKEYISEDEFTKITYLYARWEHYPERVAFASEDCERQKVQDALTTALRLVCWEKWDQLHEHLSSV